MKPNLTRHSQKRTTLTKDARRMKTSKKTKGVLSPAAHKAMLRGMMKDYTGVFAGVHVKPVKAPKLKKGQRYA